MCRWNLKKDRDKAVKLYEDWYPSLCSMIVVGVYALFFNNYSPTQINNIVDAIINYAAIILGFTGVFVSILFTLVNTRLVKTIFHSSNYKKRLQRYFIRNFQSGFCLILLSVVLYARADIRSWCESFFSVSFGIVVMDLLKMVWLFLVSYFSLSSYRLISLMIRILFGAVVEDDSENIENESDGVDDSVRALREKYDMSNNKK